MSRIQPTVVACLACGVQNTARLFESLNGERVPAQVEAILDGTFELTTCSACGAQFQPEHHMLFAQYGARVWLVMYPVASRDSFASLERDVLGVLERNFGGAPQVVSEGLRGVRPRLVFGQHGLAEALRAMRDAIDPPLLECAKLVAYQRSLSQLFGLGPTELVYERSQPDDGTIVFGVRAVPSGERLGELAIAAKLLGEVMKLLPQFEQTHPLLFQGPYVSALRYLYPPVVDTDAAT